MQRRPTAAQTHERPPIMVAVPFDLGVRLRHEAARRDLSLAALVHDLLVVIGEDGLVGAVLDDDIA